MRLLVPALAAVLLGCGEPLPSEIAALVDGGFPGCTRLNKNPIGPTEDDPHEGTKNVYACGVTLAEIAAVPGTPYPDGTLVVKVSKRDGQDYDWLVATMRKQGGAWEWSEYTRNFNNEDFIRLSVKEGVCRDCHRKVASNDWLFTTYVP